MAAQQAQPEHLLTPAEVAALVFVDPKTVSRWATAGKIPSQRTPGGHRRFRSSDVQALMPKDRSQDLRHDETVSPLLDHGAVERAGPAAAREIGRAAADAVLAEAVAIALDVQVEAAAEAACWKPLRRSRWQPRQRHPQR